MFSPIIISTCFGKTWFFCVGVWFWPVPALFKQLQAEAYSFFSSRLCRSLPWSGSTAPQSMTNFKLNQNPSHAHSQRPIHMYTHIHLCCHLGTQSLSILSKAWQFVGIQQGDSYLKETESVLMDTLAKVGNILESLELGPDTHFVPRNIETMAFQYLHDHTSKSVLCLENNVSSPVQITLMLWANCNDWRTLIKSFIASPIWTFVAFVCHGHCSQRKQKDY